MLRFDVCGAPRASCSSTPSVWKYRAKLESNVKNSKESMKPTHPVAHLKSSAYRCHGRNWLLLNGACIFLINLLCSAAAMAGPVDAKEMTPAAKIKEVAEWQPGDPLSFADGLGTFDV